MTGTWQGYYQYNNSLHQKAVGFDKTFFSITISSFDGNKFSGIVNDDVKSGGMEETGEITGEIKEGTVHFKKLMPRKSLLYSNGKQIYSNKKHPPLYYTGSYSTDKKTLSGEWKFKISIVFLFGLIPLPYRGGRGRWTMTLL